MKQLTEKTAFWYAFLLWNWLAKTGKYKSGWPGWKKYMLMYRSTIHDCPLCDFYRYHVDGGDCRVCNTKVEWTAYRYSTGAHCECYDSLYYQFRITPSFKRNKRKQIAKQLAKKFRQIHKSL